MPKVKLIYFNLTGLGEGIRTLLAYGDQEFEDVRITKEEWTSLKPTTPYGQLPILEIDGKRYAQSFSICRYLGRKYGLGGKDIEEDFEIDELMDFVAELRFKAINVLFEPDEEIKAKKHEELKNNYYPFALKKLDDIIAKNNGHVALGKLTWADFMVGGSYISLKRIVQNSNIDEEYPNIKRVNEMLMAIPKVKAYAEAAPVPEG